MTWLAFILAAVKSLPEILKLVASFKASIDAAKSEGVGYGRAVKEGLQNANARMAIANQVEQEAVNDHAAKNDDTAFDPEFQRKD